MKVEELQKAAGRFISAYQDTMAALNAQADLYPEGQGNPEIVESFSGCRTKLIEALSWNKILVSSLLAKTEEGQKAMAERLAAMEKQAEEARKEAEAKARSETKGAFGSSGVDFPKEAPNAVEG